eukprot:TRINITY_DN4612_c0_g1_i2.p1 TRINITY_DN4612_c0_g1~~TRINITY_DN4612_c0_g1_i2.p1  ORF type:complete len:681 (-),score=193.72 TRINITY_DN4612_c0_g1_i2:134-1921(-)
MDDLKKIPNEVIEKVVFKQWWQLAQDIVAKSHTQKVDLSFAVRKAVRTLKDEADELLRTLNPKYGQAQQVSPAFQWAQNDTCIFLTIKYTVRWNAPGALEVTEPSVNMSGNTFSFSGLGKHSNNKYRYSLSLKLFDFIDGSLSTWSAASVGKLSVTLRKSWTRKWPRLLVDKKAKIGNMHVWMEMQEKLDSSLSGITSASNSPATCALAKKLYCNPTDSCKANSGEDACKGCPQKATVDAENSMCGGIPSNGPLVNFQDDDKDEHEIGGTVRITKSNKDFDISVYTAFFGKDDQNRLEGEDGNFVEIGKVNYNGYGDLEIKIPQNTALTDKMTHVLVYSSNAYGEQPQPGAIIIKDAFLPKAKPAAVAFVDTDGDKGLIGGAISITVPEEHSQISDFVIYWGSSPKRKMGSSEWTVSKGDVKEHQTVTKHVAKGTKIRDGATHLIVYSKNEHGENPAGVSVKIVDLVKPCLTKGELSCPAEVRVETENGQYVLSAARAPQEAAAGVTAYSFYWGRRSCDEGGQDGAKNGFIEEMPVEKLGDQKPHIRLPADQVVPSGTTHILAFAKNAGGEGTFCASTPWIGAQDASGDKKGAEL